MEENEAFVASLKEVRLRQEHYQAVRKKIRSEFIAAVQEDRREQLCEEWHKDSREHVNSTTLEEENVFLAVRKTAKWWNILCDHSVEQKLQFEKAKIQKEEQKRMFLESVMDREQKEGKNIMESDQRRWENAKVMFEQMEKETRESCVSEALEEVLTAAQASATLIETNQIRIKEQSTLANFLISSETQKFYLEGVPHCVEEAFESIFHCNAFSTTSESVVSLLHTLYNMCNDRQKSPIFFEISRSPIMILNGPKYSGKSLLTKQLVSKYQFMCFSDYDLVEKALEAAAVIPSETSSPGPETERFNTTVERPVTWRELGLRTREALWNGGSVGVELIGELFRLQLREIPEGCEGVLVDGVINTPKEYKDVEQVLLPQVVHPYHTVYDVWLKERRIPTEEEFNQWWQVARVKLGETAKKETKTKQPRKGVDLTQLPPPVLPEVEEVEAEIAKEEEFVQKTEKELEPYGVLFSAVMHLNCDPAEIFKRYAGLRVDSETGEEYHMEFDPPPAERLPYLLNLDRTKANTAQLHDVVFNQEQQWRKFHQFFRNHKEVINVVHEIDGNRDVDAILADVDKVIQSAFEVFNTGKALYDSMKAAQDRIEALHKKRKDQEAAREEERQRLIALYTEKGVPIPPELEINEEESGFYPIPPTLPDVILQSAAEFVPPYKEQYRWGWEKWTQLASSLLTYKKFLQDNLNSLWTQPDDKQAQLDLFIREFNDVPSSYRSNITCKEELHYYVDTLANSLFHCSMQKKTYYSSALGRVTRKEIFMDDWETNVCNVGISLVSSEVERFSAVFNWILTYFSAVVGEPVTVERIEFTDLTPIKTNTGRTSEVHLADASSTKSKEKKPQTRKGHPKADDSPEKSAEDVFGDVVSKVSAALNTLVERLKMTTDVNNSKAQKRGVITPSTQRLALVAQRALSPVEEEVKRTVGRFERIHDYVAKMIAQGQEYFSNIKADYQKEIQNMFQLDASCINTAVYTLRNCIEMEKRSPAMHLGFGTFSTLNEDAVATTTLTAPKPRDPSFLTDVPLYEDVKAPSVQVLRTLDASRLMSLIQLLKSVAPDYAIGLEDFVLLVREEDYGDAALPGQRLRPVEGVFRVLDPSESGIVDWREFIVHLLFFCAPPPVSTATESYHIAEVTVQQLIEARENLGWDPLEEAVFFDIPFFFDDAMSDERLEVYTRALWETFSNPITGVMDPSDLLWFLCADVQPVRGVQKAFYVFSGTGEEGHLTAEEVYRMFHIKVGEPVGRYDPYGVDNIDILFRGREVITFNETCMEAIGRKMINSASMFQRKRFVA